LPTQFWSVWQAKGSGTGGKSLPAVDSMVLDLGMGELLLTVGVFAAVVGKKDMPVVARQAGVLVGRSVRYLRSAQRTIFGTEVSVELRAMQEELQKSLQDVQRLRHDISNSSMPRAAGASAQQNDSKIHTYARPSTSSPSPALIGATSGQGYLGRTVNGVKYAEPTVGSEAHKVNIDYLESGADFVVEGLREERRARLQEYEYLMNKMEDEQSKP